MRGYSVALSMARHLFGAFFAGFFHSRRNLMLTSSNHVVHFGADVINLSLAVKASSDLLVGLDEALELFLEAVVLVVEVGHVLVQGINFGLKFNLVSVHLIRMLAKTVNLVGNACFILLQFLEGDLELRVVLVAVFALEILIFVGLEELCLGVLVLVILGLKVAELTIKLVQRVLLILDGCVTVSNFAAALADVLLFVADHLLNA